MGGTVEIVSSCANMEGPSFWIHNYGCFVNIAIFTVRLTNAFHSVESTKRQGGVGASFSDRFESTLRVSFYNIHSPRTAPVVV